MDGYLRAAAPAADPGKECEEAGEGQARDFGQSDIVGGLPRSQD